MNETRTEAQVVDEIKNVRTQLAAASEHGPDAKRHRDRIVALLAEGHALREAAEAASTVNVGGFHIAQPPPPVAPAAPVTIPISLSKSFAGDEQDIAHALRVATAAGARHELASLLVMLDNIQPHERRTPRGASEEDKKAAADRAMETLTAQYGPERADAKATAAIAAMQELHLWRHVQARGLEFHPDVLEHFGRYGLNHPNQRT